MLRSKAVARTNDGLGITDVQFARRVNMALSCGGERPSHGLNYARMP